jgi:hypothetical protein
MASNGDDQAAGFADRLVRFDEAKGTPPLLDGGWRIASR